MQRLQTDASPPQARYDSETVRRVLARAHEIEQTAVQDEPLSAAQVEVLAAELGIAPDAVRRAMGEVVGGGVVGGAAVTMRPTSARRAGITQGDVKRALLPGLIYAAVISLLCVLYLVVDRLHLDSEPVWNVVMQLLSAAFLLVIPTLVIAVYSARQRTPLLGVLTGAFVVFAPMFVISVVAVGWIVWHGQDTHTGDSLASLMLFIAFGGALGGGSNVFWRWWQGLRANER